MILKSNGIIVDQLHDVYEKLRGEIVGESELKEGRKTIALRKSDGYTITLITFG